MIPSQVWLNSSHAFLQAVDATVRLYFHSPQPVSTWRQLGPLWEVPQNLYFRDFTQLATGST